jgi:hypothetical protein
MSVSQLAVKSPIMNAIMRISIMVENYHSK